MKVLTWVLIAIWIGGVAYFAAQSWPTMPLDLGNDEGTRIAFDQAVGLHAAYYAALALAPPVLALLVSWMFARR